MPSPENIFSGRWSEHRFVGFDKTALFYRHYSTIQSARARILVVHGMGEHGGRYRELVERLGEKEFEAFVPDLRGFGQSGGKRGCLGRFEDYHRDLDVVAQLAAKADPAHVPLFILGHSFGGLVCSSWIAESTKISPQGLILTSPNFGIAIHVPAWRQVLAVFASYLAPDQTQSTRVDSNFLTHDETILRHYKSDRLIHHQISARLYLELKRKLAQKNEIASKLTLPTLVLQAGNDHIVSLADTRTFFERLSSKDKKLEVFPSLYHEILNEAGRQAIFDQIGSWVEQRL